MSREPLLLEIGCEEIPARMIRGAAADLAARVTRLLDQAGLDHGETSHWGGPRRLAVRVEAVQPRQEDRNELVLGPPATIAFKDGKPTPAALGFAKKQGIDPAALRSEKTDKGEYVGFTRDVEGKTVGRILQEDLPASVEGMSFPKTMRWADGTHRWVRPVHWVVALLGKEILPIELFDVVAAGRSVGHRFLGASDVAVSHPDDYFDALERAHVVADPAARKKKVAEAVQAAAKALGGSPVEDPGLLEEVADLIEWPGVVGGRFDPDYLRLPREVLVTTLRHHQKCFSVQNAEGELLPAFVAVANTDRDPGEHIRRGNEWVIGGRLEDARFFWREDRRSKLADRSEEMGRVVFHADSGDFGDKAARMRALATTLAQHLGMAAEAIEACGQAAALAKNDLATGTVGEFPELQGQVGGLLLEAEGQAPGLSRGVYEHYQPAGPDADVAPSAEGGVVAVADKLDTVAELIRVGQKPTGSRDPFGLRRASSGIYRTVIEKAWAVSLNDLVGMVEAPHEDLRDFLLDRFRKFLRDSGFTANEIQAVFRPNVSPTEAFDWPCGDIVARLEALRGIRSREDFAHLVDLTKRVDNILTKGTETFKAAADASGELEGYRETSAAAVELFEMVEKHSEEMTGLEQQRRYVDAVGILARFVEPVERFFDDVLVLDPQQPTATLHRQNLLNNLRGVLTRCFDIRELAGEADRRSS